MEKLYDAVASILQLTWYRQARVSKHTVFDRRQSGNDQPMPRSLWTGTISFGLVSVPVRMVGATESKELRFHFLDKRDLQPIGYDKVRARQRQARRQRGYRPRLRG